MGADNICLRIQGKNQENRIVERNKRIGKKENKQRIISNTRYEIKRRSCKRFLSVVLISFVRSIRDLFKEHFHC